MKQRDLLYVTAGLSKPLSAAPLVIADHARFGAMTSTAPLSLVLAYSENRDSTYEDSPKPPQRMIA